MLSLTVVVFSVRNRHHDFDGNRIVFCVKQKCCVVFSIIWFCTSHVCVTLCIREGSLAVFHRRSAVADYGCMSRQIETFFFSAAHHGLHKS